MTLSPHDCLFTEGVLTLPAGYRDRTVNVFTAPGLPALTLSRDAVVPGNDLGQGEAVEATYLRGGQRVSQRQAVFARPDGRVLVFTVSADGPLTDAHRDALNGLLRSFRLHG